MTLYFRHRRNVTFIMRFRSIVGYLISTRRFLKALSVLSSGLTLTSLLSVQAGPWSMTEIYFGVSFSALHLDSVLLTPPRADNMVTTNALPDGLQPKDIWLRMDHQTFRKLPRSKGIAFGVLVSRSTLKPLHLLTFSIIHAVFLIDM